MCAVLLHRSMLSSIPSQSEQDRSGGCCVVKRVIR
uniref:Uncharacterized protein n=1 Tax=Anopheles dirus TaxID=7168 RepID=A0A182NY69_9DIPT